MGKREKTEAEKEAKIPALAFYEFKVRAKKALSLRSRWTPEQSEADDERLDREIAEFLEEKGLNPRVSAQTKRLFEPNDERENATFIH